MLTPVRLIRRVRPAFVASASLLLPLLLGGCPPNDVRPTQSGPQLANPPKLSVIGIPDGDATGPAAAGRTDGVAPGDQTVELAAAQNETVSFSLQVAGVPKIGGKSSATLRLSPLSPVGDPARTVATQYAVYQVLSMPVDMNRAGYARHTGQAVSRQKLPRALLPVALSDGAIDLSSLRDPMQPRNPNGRAGDGKSPALLWIDVAVPPGTKAGDYQATCEVVQDGRHVSSVPLKLAVHDFVIPDERHLQMVGRLDWNNLSRLYPELFEAVTPALMTRKEPKYAETIRTLDGLVKLAQQHRTQLVVPRLQPQVKWPAGKLPQVDWEGFDSVAGPWLRGNAFADHVPLGFWPLPAADYLDRYDLKSQGEYWNAAAAHFDAFDWLARAPVQIGQRLLAEKRRAGVADAMELSAEAARLLALHPKLRVSLPLEDDQVQFKSEAAPKLVDPASTERLAAAAPGLVSAPPTQPWPLDLPGRPRHWLRTELPGLVPYAGAGGDERDVRLWAWLAFLRRADCIEWNGALPTYTDADAASDPDELVWFYPGRWFGVADPLPTIQLKWLRRAEQDFEYLHLARERGAVINALVMARLLTKPVEIQPSQEPDPTYALMCGTTDAAAWRDAQDILARTILLRPPGGTADRSLESGLNVDTMHWIEPQEKPLMMGRTVQWGWGANHADGNWIDLRLGLDIYNASDQRLEGELQWSGAPQGWQVQPQPIAVTPRDAINTYNVKRFKVDGSVDLDHLGKETRQPIDLAFTNAMTRRMSLARMVIPVAASEKREGRIELDGKLEDWDAGEALHADAPLVRMLSRPLVQQQALQFAATKSSIYSDWASQNIYLAFKLDGVTAQESMAEKSFVDYQSRRAWGEDLCEFLVQAVYVDNSLGPVVHVVCKPRGQLMVETKLNPRVHANPWQPVIGAEVRYAMKAEPSPETPGFNVWRGELAIPWSVINDVTHQGVRPTLLRFNAAQHRAATGESASWAGPVDFGRDEGFMGLLYLREPRN